MFASGVNAVWKTASAPESKKKPLRISSAKAHSAKAKMSGSKVGPSPFGVQEEENRRISTGASSRVAQQKSKIKLRKKKSAIKSGAEDRKAEQRVQLFLKAAAFVRGDGNQSIHPSAKLRLYVGFERRGKREP